MRLYCSELPDSNFMAFGNNLKASLTFEDWSENLVELWQEHAETSCGVVAYSHVHVHVGSTTVERL